MDFMTSSALEFNTSFCQVAELRSEMAARNQPTKGLKNQLMNKLVKILKSEMEAEQQKQGEEAKENEQKDTTDTEEKMETAEQTDTAGDKVILWK